MFNTSQVGYKNGSVIPGKYLKIQLNTELMNDTSGNLNRTWCQLCTGCQGCAKWKRTTQRNNINKKYYKDI